MTSQLPHSPYVSQSTEFSPPSSSTSSPANTNAFLCFSKLADGKFLVNISLVMSTPLFQTTCTIPASFNSLKKNCFTSMCLVLPPTVQLLHKSLAPLLSTCNIIGNFTFSCIEFKSLMMNIMSCTQSIAANNSASVTDNTTIDII